MRPPGGGAPSPDGAAPAPAPAPGGGWVYDASTGYYHNPVTGTYFDQQRGAYSHDGRWLSHAEFTAMTAGASASRHLAHPSLSRGGGVGDARGGGGGGGGAGGRSPANPTDAASATARASATAASGARWGGDVYSAYQPADVAATATATAAATAPSPTPSRAVAAASAGASAAAPSPSNAISPTALHKASERGDVAAVRERLLAGDDPDAPGPRGNRPLHYAAYEGHLKVVELLLADGGGGADARARNDVGVAPLHNATSRGHADCVDVRSPHTGPHTTPSAR